MWSTVCPLPNVFAHMFLMVFACLTHARSSIGKEMFFALYFFVPDVPVTASWPRTSTVATLFRAISNGMNWGDGADALASIDGGMFWVMILYFYIAFCSVLVASRWLQVGFICPKAIDFVVF